jgi:hypothetical protein
MWSAGFSLLCEALANGDEAMAIDIISTDRIYKFGRVHIIETWLNVKALVNLGGVEWKSLAKFAVRRPKLKTLEV